MGERPLNLSIKLHKAGLSYAFYFFLFYFFLAYIAAYLPLLCQGWGMTNRQIAVVSTCGSLGGIIGPIVAQYLGHYWLSCRLLFVVFILACLSAQIAVIGTFSFSLFCLFCFISLTANRAAASIGDAQAIRDAYKLGFSFERARMCGSFSFVLATLICGSFFDAYGYKSLYWLGVLYTLLPIFAVFLLWDNLATVPKISLFELPATQGVATEADFGRFMKPSSWAVFCLLLVNFLSSLSQSTYYSFFSVHLSNLGWSGRSISWAWSLGVIVEIAFLLFYPKFSRLISLGRFLQVSLLLNSLRLLILGVSTETSLIWLSQFLHIFSFCGIYLNSVRIAHETFPDALRDRGQAVLVGVNGAGSLIGRLFLITLASQSEITLLFTLSAFVSLAAFVISMFSRQTV